MLRYATAVAAALAVLVATPALAQITIEEVIAIARDHGMEQFKDVELDDGKWEVDGHDADGRELEIDIDAMSGEVLNIDHD